ncbi:hypothetical protein ACRASX_16080 [Flavobacterium sp. TMP13]|uniref:hypothetical protein n=1 Tax=unclassified Flavobacterium TaxID=196869 RepID=UPI00076C22CA|nr:hypothetical protein [Flavobacterium sp. TAB 87]KVV15566.1 hypothetical protein AP058_00850 [Flavobacterium sp. TAB 87]
MKSIYILSNILLIAVLSSCVKNNKDQVVVPPLEVEAPMETPVKECYQAIVDKDTITLTVDVNSINEFKGELNYSYYQKDKSFGTILGNVKGDTIFAEYNYQSEGKTSVRELAFLKKDATTYIEGYGDVVEANDKVVFKDKSKIKFDGNVIYNKIDCKE